MARFGTWRPLADNWASQPRIKQHDILCLHTAVGSLWGTDAYFRQGGYGGTESHWGVGYDGEILQWQDTDFQADANYHGTWHILSIETADVGDGFPKWNTGDGNAVPAWTDAQCKAIAQILAWASKAHGIPLELIPDSKPGRRGVGYHRQGVPGYMVPGGEAWSTAAGKVCPGNRRIAQIPGVIAQARALAAGGGQVQTPTGSDEDMILLHSNTGKQDGPGAFGASDVAVMSGPLFARVLTTGAFEKAAMQDAISNRHAPAIWVSYEEWKQLEDQAALVRGDAQT